MTSRYVAPILSGAALVMAFLAFRRTRDVAETTELLRTVDERLDALTYRSWSDAPSTDRSDNAMRIRDICDVADNLIKEGEWTTVDDIGKAMTNETRWGSVVNQIVHDRQVIHPQRILLSDGSVRSGWYDAWGGARPEDCIAVLMSEGVPFPDGIHADPAHRLRWEELQRRYHGR